MDLRTVDDGKLLSMGIVRLSPDFLTYIVTVQEEQATCLLFAFYGIQWVIEQLVYGQYLGHGNVALRV